LKFPKVPALFSIILLSLFGYSAEEIRNQTQPSLLDASSDDSTTVSTEEISLAQLQTQEAAPPSSSLNGMQKNNLKIRAAAFFPQGVLTRQIYHKFWPEGSIEYNYSFFRHISCFANGAVTGMNGHSRGVRHNTTIIVVPVTFGINKLWGSSWWHPYVGFGVGFAYAHIHNVHSCVRKYENHWGFASLFQTGVELDVSRSFYMDLFAAYRFNWFHFNVHHNIRATGGLDLGFGGGYRF
jgi:hypothetical protein